MLWQPCALFVSQGILATYGPGRGVTVLSWQAVDSASPILTHRWQAFQCTHQGQLAGGSSLLIQEFGGSQVVTYQLILPEKWSKTSCLGMEPKRHLVQPLLFTEWRNWGSERLCNLSKVTQQGRSRVRTSLIFVYCRHHFSVYFGTEYIAWSCPYTHGVPRGHLPNDLTNWPAEGLERVTLSTPASLQDNIRTLWSGNSLLSSSKLSTNVEVTASLGCCQRETKLDTS